MKYILDVGCGNGYRTYQLSKSKDASVTGIDISESSIEIARNRYPNVTFKRMSSEKIDFASESFDEIHAIDVLEHVDNLEPTLNEITRILKVRGILSVVVPNDVSERWLLKVRPSFQDEIHHVRIFNDADFKALLNKMGYILKKTERRNFMQHFELYYFFKTQKVSETQLEIGKWDASFLNKVVHITSMLFDPYWVFHTPLKYIPIWLITLPIGFVVNYFGNKVMPKSMYYEFEKVIQSQQ